MAQEKKYDPFKVTTRADDELGYEAAQIGYCLRRPQEHPITPST